MSNDSIALSGGQTAMRVATVAAFVTGIALVVKVVLILATSNAAPAAATGALYAIGVFTPVVVAIDVARRRASLGAKIAVGVGIVVAHLVYVTMLSDAVEALVAPFTSTAYVLDEVPIMVLGVIWLMVGVKLLRHER
jgi:hypothetical protein